MLSIEITNDQTGTDESANYEYVVRVNWREVARGKVSGHNRKHYWWVLLGLIAEEAKDHGSVKGVRHSTVALAERSGVARKTNRRKSVPRAIKDAT